MKKHVSHFLPRTYPFSQSQEVHENTDIWAWNAGIGIGVASFVVWAMSIPFLEAKNQSILLGIYFLVAAVFRGIFTLRCNKKTAFRWSGSGAALLAVTGIVLMLADLNPWQIVLIASAPLFIDILVAFIVSRPYEESHIRTWTLLGTPLVLIAGLLFGYPTIQPTWLWINFLSVIMLTLHSVVAFSLFLHLKEKL
jgi:uncharacterized membrane protein HdeD (DUF308 family)